MNNIKITLICGRTFTVFKFRKGLVEALQHNNYDVSIIALDSEYENQIKKWNVDFYCINQNNRSINPFQKIILLYKISKLLYEIKPDKVFTFMLTPNIFGVLAAHKSKIKDIYSMVEGAGDVFVYNTLKWKIIRYITCKLYKCAFKYSKIVFFLNNDDRKEFIDRKLVKQKQCKVIPGIGVDTDYFVYKPIKNTNVFLMIARMMPSKGVIEYCEAARIVKKMHPEAIFNYIGEEFTLTRKDIQEYIDDGSINYLGYQEDVRPYLEDCFVFVLPSYREGMPITIMEAEATGRAIITCNSIGCKDTVENGKNGFLVNKEDIVNLSFSMLKFLDELSLYKNMGLESKNIVESRFSRSIINKKICEVII